MIRSRNAVYCEESAGIEPKADEAARLSKGVMMAGQGHDLDSLVKALYDFASEKMKANATDDEIMAALAERGLNREFSLIIVGNLRKAFNDARGRG
jgi:hypothetical protein